MVEALTAEERDAFMGQANRIGSRAILVSMLDVRGVKRFSELTAHDRAVMLTEMRKLPGAGKR